MLTDHRAERMSRYESSELLCTISDMSLYTGSHDLTAHYWLMKNNPTQDSRSTCINNCFQMIELQVFARTPETQKNILRPYAVRQFLDKKKRQVCQVYKIYRYTHSLHHFKILNAVI